MTEERWLPVVGYEGLYEVSDHGRVRSLDRFIPSPRGKSGKRRHKGRILAATVSPATGYRTVTLADAAGGRKLYYALVHRLVLEAFVGPCPDGMECCHKDLDRSNEALSNLRWDTRSANTLDAVNHKTNANARRTHCPRGHPYDRVEKRRDRTGRACKKCRDDLRRERTNARVRSSTHCFRGHPLDGVSKRSDGTPRRYCKTCALEAGRRYRERRKSTAG